MMAKLSLERVAFELRHPKLSEGSMPPWKVTYFQRTIVICHCLWS